jgi:hypothetical protein
VILTPGWRILRPTPVVPPSEPDRDKDPRTSVGYADGAVVPGLAVTCDHDDIDTMVRHALIRRRYREERGDQ